MWVKHGFFLEFSGVFDEICKKLAAIAETPFSFIRLSHT